MLGAGRHARPQGVNHALAPSEAFLDFVATLLVQCRHPALHLCCQGAFDNLLCYGRLIVPEIEVELVADLRWALLLEVHRGDIAVQLKHGLKEVLWEVHGFVFYERLQVLEHLNGK